MNTLMLLGPEASQAPFASYDAINRRWRVWLSFNSTVDSGTYIDLYQTGLSERVTVKKWVIQEIVRLTNPPPLQDLYLMERKEHENVSE